MQLCNWDPTLTNKMVKNNYKPTLVHFMRWKDGVVCSKDHEFEQEALSQMRPQDVVRWMQLKAHGVADPGPDDLPTQAQGRSSSLMCYKKALSSFMPNKRPAWMAETQSGNPTKSADANDLTARIKKHEAREQGAPSQARRPMAKTKVLRKSLML